MQPLEDGFADQIEGEHMAHFRSQRLEEASHSAKGPKPGVKISLFIPFFSSQYSNNQKYLNHIAHMIHTHSPTHSPTLSLTHTHTHTHIHTYKHTHT